MSRDEKIKEELHKLNKVVAFLKTDDDTYPAGEEVEIVQRRIYGLLESGPDPTEFTLVKRGVPKAYLEEDKDKCNENVSYLCKTILEACDIIDCLTAENNLVKSLCKDNAVDFGALVGFHKDYLKKINDKDAALRRIAEYGNEPMSLSMASEIARDALKHD